MRLHLGSRLKWHLNSNNLSEETNGERIKTLEWTIKKKIDLYLITNTFYFLFPRVHFLLFSAVASHHGLHFFQLLINIGKKYDLSTQTKWTI